MNGENDLRKSEEIHELRNKESNENEDLDKTKTVRFYLSDLKFLFFFVFKNIFQFDLRI